MLNTILDLDETLVSAVSFAELKQLSAVDEELQRYRERSYDWIDMEDSYRIFERPNLQKFLTFVFSNFNVSVWTAASKRYAVFIVENIILRNHPSRKLNYLFFSHHCRTRASASSDRKCNNYKNLRLLNDEFDLPHFKIDDTYIVDDHPNVCKIQPNNCINVVPFNIDKETMERKDDHLMSVVVPKLLDIKRRRESFRYEK